MDMMTTTTDRSFNLNGRIVRVQTLDEARALWVALRDADALGASDMARGCGEYREGGVLVARVSYNGRMWAADGSEIR
jgi:hypothetical protein